MTATFFCGMFTRHFKFNAICVLNLLNFITLKTVVTILYMRLCFNKIFRILYNTFNYKHRVVYF